MVNMRVNVNRSLNTCVILSILWLSAVANAAQQEDVSEPPCTLYLAQSSVAPNAGLGIYTGIPLQEGQDVLSSTIFGDDQNTSLFVLAIQDTYKTLPYRGEKRFQSWMAYLWPSEPDAFSPTYKDEVMPPLKPAFYLTTKGLTGVWQEESLAFYDTHNNHDESDDDDITYINAFVPGIPSLTNSHETWQNLHQVFTEDPDASDSNGRFQTTRDLEAGSELLFWYGQEYEDRETRSKKYKQPKPKYETLDFWMVKLEKWAQERKEYPKEHIKRFKQKKMKAQIDDYQIRKLEKLRRAEVEKVLEQKNTTLFQIPIDEAKTNPTPRSDNTAMLLPESDTNTVTIPPANLTKSLPWLQNHGICLDGIRPGKSRLDDLEDPPEASKGAFANRPFRQGTIVVTTPLLVIRREDLDIYASNPEETKLQKVLDLKKLVGQELLLNYCYGHPQSDILFAPTAPHVNLINHNKDAEKVNVRLEWPSEELVRNVLGKESKGPNEWFDQHPLVLLEESGKVLLNIVATKDIQKGDELYLDYGDLWNHAYTANKGAKTPFRHEIGVPRDFFSQTWLQTPVKYELAEIETIQPGEIIPLTWKHNGERVANASYVIGLPEHFADRVIEFSEERGILSLYRQLLLWKNHPEEYDEEEDEWEYYDDVLQSNQWYVFRADQHVADEDMAEEWFVHRFRSTLWDFNMHYVSAWNEIARKEMWKALLDAGLSDILLESMGNYFNLESLTCFHHSFMGISHADKSRMHTDLFATGNKAFTLIFPLILAETNDQPELQIQSDNADIVVPIKYQFDRAVLMGDWGYHSTAPVDYGDSYDEKSGTGDVRVVFQMYCAEINEANREIIRHHYNEEDPAPFMNQFDDLATMERHWSRAQKSGAEREVEIPHDASMIYR